jgi:uncharacterized membrane protein YdjX (TVP38/TMEM64 family)
MDILKKFKSKKTESADTTHKASDPNLKKQHIYEWIVLIVVIIISVLIFVFRHQLIGLKHLAVFGPLGYLAAFLINMIGSGSIVVPFPSILLIAVLGTILNPILVGIAATIGGTIGEMTGYGLGYGGRLALEKVPMYDRMVGWMQKRGSLTIFLLALIPNPLFDIAGAAAGALKYPVWKFMIFGALGRLPKTIMYAYMGFWVLKIFPGLS